MIKIRNWYLRTAVFLAAAALGYGAVVMLQIRARQRDWRGSRSFNGGRIETFFQEYGCEFPPPATVESRVISRHGVVGETARFEMAAEPFAAFLANAAKRFEVAECGDPADAARVIRAMADRFRSADLTFPPEDEWNTFAVRLIRVCDCPVYLMFRRHREAVTGWMLILYDSFL
ncbi:MAG: hypothetical protein MR051_02245 [Lentisphaeria bacterium]|nr:hypothetical protein [Lentisphaeria bacterium]